MDIYDAIQKRYSVRAYLPKPVEKEKLLRILEAAFYAELDAVTLRVAR